MVQVVYFNQWFSSIGYVIDDLKKRHKNNIKIIASSKNKDHVYKKYVDEFIFEDWVEGKTHEESMKNYTDWILKLCIKYNVDFFFVKKHVKYIMERSNEFSMNRIFLVSETYDKLVNLDNKSKVYSELIKNMSIYDYIPSYMHTKNLSEATRYLSEHRDKNDICLKLDSDEGGASFRSINDNRVTSDSLHEFSINEINTDNAINIAITIDDISKILFMEKLDNPEISVDCYNSKQGFVAICREKSIGRTQRIFYNSEISNICREIGNQLKLVFPYNVQFRIKHCKDSSDIKNWRVLEVNPRMSGGLYYEIPFGFNIADICLNDLMNTPDNYSIDDYIGFSDKYITHIEQPIKIND